MALGYLEKVGAYNLGSFQGMARYVNLALSTA